MFVKEVFKWRSVAIIGGQPHAAARDDYYKGWLIPKNTWVQGIICAIHHNEQDFPEPDRFKPERFFQITDCLSLLKKDIILLVGFPLVRCELFINVIRMGKAKLFWTGP